MTRPTDIIDMPLPEILLTVFSGETEDRAGTPVVRLPERELELDIGEPYRIAVLSQPEPRTESTSSEGEAFRDRRRAHEASEPPVEEAERYEVEIETLGVQGDGTARVGPGCIVFVSKTAVGDRVTVEITQVQENFGVAEVVEEEPITG